jgi:hypothetical protein
MVINQMLALNRVQTGSCGVTSRNT